MAEGVDLAAGRGLVDERIVGGDGVAAATRRMVDVDPQDRGPQVGDVLPGPVWIFGKVVAAVGDFGGMSGGRVSGGSIESRFCNVVEHG